MTWALLISGGGTAEGTEIHHAQVTTDVDTYDDQGSALWTMQ